MRTSNTGLNARLIAATMLAGLAFVSSPAFADETDPPSDFTFSGYVQGVSDYRFRGLSLSGGDPAIQGSINLNHSSGFYVGTWASSLEQDAADVYGSTELDLYGGWTGEVTSGLTADVGLLYYVYPAGGSGKGNYFEPYASLTGAVGPATAKVGVAYAPSQDSLGNDDNLYVYGELGAGIPNTPISLAAHLGYADGVQSPDRLTGKGTGGGFDYSLGATYNITPKFSVGASYVGVDGNKIDSFSDDTVVATVKLAF
ncbi:TorF family putative porin [Novosphingobium tardum]|uniref:TorF family putative porin n=1 Tax=Novosphingobium tardum TaxID=1538021 RepID=A0ABV8RQE6_9SPHN